MVNRRGIFRALLIVGSVSIVVAAGFAVRSYLQVKDAGPELTAFLNKPTVEITSPKEGDAFETGVAIELDIYAISQTALLTSLELQIDGVTAEVQAAPGPGRSPFSTHFTFAASEPGSHTLLAKAVDSLGFESYSVPIQIEITENEGAEQAPFYSSSSGPIVLSSGQSLPPPPPPPPPPDPSNPPTQADFWTVSVGNWFSPPNSSEPVSPPELDARVKKCAVDLFIEDFNDYEEGFSVFRHVEFNPGWVRIATLSPMPGSLSSFVDENPPSGPVDVSYYVEAFNKYHTAPSNVEKVSISPDPDCASLYEGPPGFTVEMDNLTINQPVESAYCYRSFDGVSWHRWPDAGFFTPGEDGSIETHESPIVFFTEDFDGKPINTEISISLDCWGWLGGALIPLGDFTNVLNPGITEGQFVGTGDITSQVVTVSNFKPIKPEYSAATLPRYTMGLTFDPNTCKQHIAPAETPEYFKTCASPYPGYHLGPEGVAPQGFLVWDIHDLECQAGSGYLHCIPWVEWLKWLLKFQFAGEDSRQMSWWISDTHGPSAFIENPLQMAYAIPPADRECNSYRTLTLNLYVDTVTIVIGPKVSITIACDDLKPVGDSGYVDVEVRFSQLVFNSVNDGLLNHTIEVDGHISVYLECVGYKGAASPGTGCFDNYNHQIPNNQLVNGLGGISNTYWYQVYGMVFVPAYNHFGNGTYALSDRLLLDSQKQKQVSPITILRLPVSSAQRMIIALFLVDTDDPGKDDVACNREEVVGPANLNQVGWWPGRNNFHVSVHSPANGTAACWLDVYLTALK